MYFFRPLEKLTFLNFFSLPIISKRKQCIYFTQDVLRLSRYIRTLVPERFNPSRIDLKTWRGSSATDCGQDC